MNRHKIYSLTNPGEDEEIARYKILGVLKEYLSNIRKNKLYPTLTDLVSLSVKLENMIVKTLEPNESANNVYPDSEEEEIYIYGNLDSGEEPYDDTNEMIKWTRQQLYPILDEGIAVYEFVEENLHFQLINGVPFSKDNGYMVIPEHKTGQFNVYSYHCILFKTDAAPIKSIKTLYLQSIPINNEEKISDQFQTMINNIGNISLPVFYCDTDLDFPYEETIFQIARKKLLKILSM